jgi:hypothetical protein
MPRGVKTAEYFCIAASAFVSGRCAWGRLNHSRAGKEGPKRRGFTKRPHLRVSAPLNLRSTRLLYEKVEGAKDPLRFMVGQEPRDDVMSTADLDAETPFGPATESFFCGSRTGKHKLGRCWGAHCASAKGVRPVAVHV